MGFDIEGPDSRVSIEHEADALLDLPERVGVPVPQFARISQQFYGGFEIAGADLRGFAADLRDLRVAYRTQRSQELMRERQVNAGDPALVQQILDRMLETDPVHGKLVSLIECCEAALQIGEPLRCSGD